MSELTYYTYSFYCMSFTYCNSGNIIIFDIKTSDLCVIIIIIIMGVIMRATEKQHKL